MSTSNAHIMMTEVHIVFRCGPYLPMGNQHVTCQNKNDDQAVVFAVSGNNMGRYWDPNEVRIFVTMCGGTQGTTPWR